MAKKKKQSKITKSARNEACAIRLPSICTFNDEQTVFCHINTVFKGVGLKSPDLFGVYGCAACHDVLDNRRKHDFSEAEIYEATLDALIETQSKLVDKGLLKVV